MLRKAVGSTMYILCSSMPAAVYLYVEDTWAHPIVHYVQYRRCKRSCPVCISFSVNTNVYTLIMIVYMCAMYSTHVVRHQYEEWQYRSIFAVCWSYDCKWVTSYVLHWNLVNHNNCFRSHCIVFYIGNYCQQWHNAKWQGCHLMLIQQQQQQQGWVSGSINKYCLTVFNSSIQHTLLIIIIINTIIVNPGPWLI